ncbi:hypothetical protein J4X42_08855, partial [Escherichia coli]
FIVGGPVGDFELLLCHGTVCVVGKIRDLILQLSKSSIYSTKPPDSRTSLTAASSSTPIAGREKGKNSDIAFPSAIEYLSTYICYKECCVYFAIWSEILRIEY